MIKLFLLLFLLCVSALAQTATYPAGQYPEGLAFDGSNIWVANASTGKVTKLRASDGSTLGEFAVGSSPFGVAFDGQNIWVTNSGSNNVTKLRTADGTAIGTFAGTNPTAILFDGANIWIGGLGTVTKLRPSDGSTLGTYPTGSNNSTLGITFDGTNVWITDYYLGNAIKMRASDGAVLGKFSTGSSPRGVGFDGTNIWVANFGSNNVAKLRATDGTLLGTFPTGASPNAVLFDGENIWVTNLDDSTVMKLRPTDGNVLAIMPTGPRPFGIAFDGANIWVTNQSGNTVTKMNALSVSTAITTSPPNLTLQLDGVNSTTPAFPNWAVGSSHQIGVSSPQTTSISRYVFSHWSDGGAQTHSIVVQPISYTAFFDSQYLLERVASPVEGGTISAVPGSTDGFYNAGTSVQLLAQPSPGFVFSSFTGDVSGPTSPQTITMDRPRGVTAYFNNNCTYSLNPSSAAVGNQASTGTVALISGAGCQWIAGSNASWITLTSPTSGSGPTTVSFSVSANPNTISRTGTINIAGQLFTITQSASTSPQTGLRFVPLPPCRLMETRPEYNFQGRTGPFGPPFMAANETRTLTPANSNVCQVPAAAKAYVLNVTLVPRGSVDFVTIWPAGDPRPDVWTIRSPDGNTVANSTIVKAGTGSSISVYASNATDLLLDISGYFTDTTATSNLVYYPLAPCRVIDTRIVYRAPGPFGPPSMGTQETRRFRFPATPYCQVPTGAAAYSMTITAVPQGPLQFLTAWADGPPQLTVSTINSPAGRILANSAIVPASTDGSISVFTFNQSDVLFDITGYFAPDDGANGLMYFPVTQCRASDSTISGGIYADDTVRTIAIPSAAGCAGIPANARAYAVNVTALPGGNPMPFLTAYPTGQSRPGASILNAFEGQTVTNSAIVPAGANGAIDVYAYRATHVVVEISGYFGR